MRLGVFGGSFDPVHLGHLQLAEACCDQARLDRVDFIPAAQQPHKPRGPVAGAEHRVAMLRLATEGRTEFDVSTAEIDRGRVSYTVDTLRAIKAASPEAELFLLMGSDSLADLPNWREAPTVCELAIPLVVRRGGHPAPDFGMLSALMTPARLAEARRVQVEMAESPISSSEIQRLIAADGDWQLLVPAAVARYIEQHRLYGT